MTAAVIVYFCSDLRNSEITFGTHVLSFISLFVVAANLIMALDPRCSHKWLGFDDRWSTLNVMISWHVHTFVYSCYLDNYYGEQIWKEMIEPTSVVKD